VRRHISLAAVLAAGTAATVLWQNARLTVLWDASYILENAARIAGGDVPYRDFPFPYAPLTFVLQAAIIKLFGHVWWHHVAWAVAAAAAATALTFVIARRLVPTSIVLIVSLPLILLGIYCIFPHPFYDPDSCLVLLIVIASLVALDARGWPRNATIIVGAACVVPLFVKQNIGLAFLAAIVLCAMAMRRWWLLAGVAGGAAIALALVAIICGVGNYVQWTITFAAARRLPPIAEQLAIYNDPDLWWWVACVVIGVRTSRPHGGRVRTWTSALLICAPFLWSAWRVYASDDPNEPEINFLRLWPLMLVVGVVVAIATWRRERGFVRLLPLVIVATVHGVFLSQSTWGSTYGIWPLLILLVALALRPLPRAAALPVAIVFAATTLHAAWPYIRDEHRLTYVKWSEGEMARAQLPALRGMHMRGLWLPDFEELVAFTGRVIPRGDAILCMPGEDLFYFTTGRRPQFPVLMFDRTINPYDPATIARIAAERHVKWVIVKKRLQLNGTPMPELPEVLRRMNVTRVAQLRNYDLYTNGEQLPARRSGEPRPSTNGNGG
jgi:hypothetical protein